MPQLRLALRRLARAPLFSVAVIAMLGTTLAAVTLVASLVYAAKFRPLPMTDPASVISIWQNDDTRAATPLQDVVPGDVLAAWRARQVSFTDLAAFYSRRLRTTDKQVKRIEALVVDGHYFLTLALHPMLGRGVLPADAAEGAPPVAVLSEASWRSDRGADPAIVGSTVRLDEQAYTIIGVLPTSANILGTPLWISAPGAAAWPTTASYEVIGRLRTGQTIARAQAELATLLPRADSPQAVDAPRPGVLLIPLAQSLRDMSGTAVLFVAATLLLALVAIANIGTLFLVRVLASLRQMAIRTAIGATSGRLRTDAALDGALLGATAGVLGMVGAAYLRLALHSFVSTMVTSNAEQLPLAWPVLVATMVVAIAAGLLIALAAHATTRHLDIASYLHGVGAGSSRRQASWRLLLVGVQVTAALIACVAATRLIASSRYVSHISVGFETDHLVAAQLPIWSTPLGTDSGAQRLVANLAPLIANTPGLGTPAIWATIGFRLPKGPDDKAIAIDGIDQNFSLHCNWSSCPVGAQAVSDNAFAVLGIPLVRGRGFTAADRGGPPVAVVNAQAQHAWFGDADPIGRRIQVRGSDAPEQWRTVVGVVANAAELNEMGRNPRMYDRAATQPFVYEPLSQAQLHQGGLMAGFPMVVAVRPEQPVSAAIATMRKVLAGALPDVETPVVSTMTAVYSSEFGSTRLRLYTEVVATIAALTVLLAVLGIFGAVAEVSRSRTREIGIRLALGSSRGGVVKVVCRSAAGTLFAGVAAGVMLAVLMESAMARVVFGGAPSARPRGILLMGPDVTLMTLCIAAAAILVVGLLAAGAPALRASRLDPATVLRSDGQ